MSKKATEFQRKAMSWMYRGKEIFKPLNTGWIDENVACVREWVANIFFYRKGDTTIMVDAGYNYDRLAEKMGWLGIDPKSIHHILITHQDTDHVGAVEADSPGLFRNAKLYIGEIENRYLTGEVRRKVIYHLYKLPQVTINNEKVLLHDGRVLDIGDTTIMIDAGYNYDRLAEKMGWLEIDPKSIHHILITHQDTDHVGAVEADSPGLFRNAKLYIGEIENRYLTGEVRRKVIYHLYKLPQVTINNEKVLLHDGQVLDIDGIKIECFLVPGHTWGHMVYLIDDKYLFTGDTLWFGADGGYSFISSLAEDNKLAVQSLAELERKLRARGLHPYFITGHTGWTDNFAFAFAHKDKSCSPFKKRVHDPSAPYDAYDESDDTEENAKSGFLKGVGR